MRIKEDQKYLTVFRTSYGQFEYTVMAFEITNILAIFQSYIDATLSNYLDNIVRCYLDNILIYTNTDNPKKHVKHICKVLQKLWDNLYCKISKYEFSIKEVGFLGFIASTEGVAIEPDWITTIKDCLTPKSVRDIQVLLSFTNFYWCFIQKYS